MILIEPKDSLHREIDEHLHRDPCAYGCYQSHPAETLWEINEEIDRIGYPLVYYDPNFIRRR